MNSNELHSLPALPSPRDITRLSEDLNAANKRVRYYPLGHPKFRETYNFARHCWRAYWNAVDVIRNHFGVSQEWVLEKYNA